MTVTAPPDALSDAARRFLEGPQQLLIGGERRPAARRAHLRDDRPGDRRGDRAGRAGGRRGRRRRRAGRARRRSTTGARGARLPAAERGQLLNRLADLIEEHADELARARVARQRQAGQATRARSTSALTVAHFRYFAGWPTKIEGEVIPVARRRHARLHAQGAGRRLRPDHPVELPAADGRRGRSRRRWPPAARWC